MSCIYLGSSSLAVTSSISVNGRKLVTPLEVIMESSFDSICYRTSNVDISLRCLGINWKVNKTYTISVDSGFLLDAEDGSTNNPITLTYTTPTKIAEISSTNPVKASTNSTNNTRIVLNYDSPVYPVSGNFYIYENTPVPTLLKTVNVNSDIFSNNNQTITLDVRGLLKANTSYFVLSDTNILDTADRQFYNFYVSKINSGDYYYTTVDEPYFHDFIALVSSTGDVYLNPLVYRNPGSSNYTANFTQLTNNLRVRYFTSDQSANFVQSTIGKYYKGTIQNLTATVSLNNRPNFKFVTGCYMTVDAGLTAVGQLRTFVDASANLYVSAQLELMPSLIYVLSESGQQNGDYFGSTVANTNNQMITGAFGYDTSYPNEGRIYVYDLPSGSIKYTVNDPNPGPTINNQDYFGRCVSITNNYFSTGAEREGYTLGQTEPNQYGKVYVYNMSDASLKLTISAPTNCQNFGFRNVITNSYVFARGILGTNYAFNMSDGSFVSTMGSGELIADSNYVVVANGGNFISYGTSDLTTQIGTGSAGTGTAYTGKVTLYGSMVAAGDPYNNSSSGSIKVYDIYGNFIYALANPGYLGNYSNYSFGISLAMSEAYLFVGDGAIKVSTNNNAGVVHIFKRTTGEFITTITAPTPTANESFGASISCTNNYLTVGTNATGTGKVYLYKLN